MNPFEMPDELLLHVNDQLKGLEILFLGLVVTRLYKITSPPHVGRSSAVAAHQASHTDSTNPFGLHLSASDIY